MTPTLWAAARARATWRRISAVRRGERVPHVGELLREVVAVEVLHHQEEAAVGELAGVEDLDDVGVADRGGDAGLGLEAAGDEAVAGPLAVQDLDGDAAADRQVLGEVDGAHAAGAEPERMR
jgi:hypothetical protein